MILRDWANCLTSEMDSAVWEGQRNVMPEDRENHLGEVLKHHTPLSSGFSLSFLPASDATWEKSWVRVEAWPQFLLWRGEEYGDEEFPHTRLEGVPRSDGIRGRGESAGVMLQFPLEGDPSGELGVS